MEERHPQGLPASYLGLQSRYNKPPQILVNTPGEPFPQTAEYHYRRHSLSESDILKIADDLTVHPVASIIVSALVETFHTAPTQIIKVFLAHKVPYAEMQTWSHILQVCGLFADAPEAEAVAP